MYIHWRLVLYLLVSLFCVSLDWNPFFFSLSNLLSFLLFYSRSHARAPTTILTHTHTLTLFQKKLTHENTFFLNLTYSLTLSLTHTAPSRQCEVPSLKRFRALSHRCCMRGGSRSHSSSTEWSSIEHARIRCWTRYVRASTYELYMCVVMVDSWYLFVYFRFFHTTTFSLSCFFIFFWMFYFIFYFLFDY